MAASPDKMIDQISSIPTLNAEIAEEDDDWTDEKQEEMDRWFAEQAQAADTNIQPAATIEDLQYQIIIERSNRERDKLHAAQQAKWLAIGLENSMSRRAEESKESLEAQSMEIKRQGEVLTTVQAKLEEMWKNLYLPKLQYDAKIREIESNPLKSTYFNAARKILKQKLTVMEVLSSRDVERSSTTLLDFVAKGLKHLADHLPSLACGVVKSGAGLVQTISDERELGKNIQAMQNAAHDQIKFSDEVAMELVARCFPGSNITNEKIAVAVAEKHVEQIRNVLRSKLDKDLSGFEPQGTLANRIIQVLIMAEKLPTSSTSQNPANGKPLTPALEIHQQRSTNPIRDFFTRRSEQKAAVAAGLAL